ncbi:hypothetical protein [Thermus sp.]|uniref:hypothetical protein n=1 Tax=Thermus sp. TaxID=275 RepID=UPI00298F2C65|nr:hypothetical protein [Thermus sp.]MDW8358837.1 hypothetical protein [Thermus sp.]
MVRRVALPSARTGILAGLFLALARALGETMAVTMVIGNAHGLPYTLFGGAATMPSVIANEFTEAVTPLHLSALLGVGFLLFLVSRLLISGGRILGLGGRPQGRRPEVWVPCRRPPPSAPPRADRPTLSLLLLGAARAFRDSPSGLQPPAGDLGP